MPKNSFFEPASRDLLASPNAGISSDTAQVDQWAHDSFWESIRARHGDTTPLSDRDPLPVGARFVLFADGSGAFLPEDRSVVEIADRFDRGVNFDAMGNACLASLFGGASRRATL